MMQHAMKHRRWLATVLTAGAILCAFVLPAGPASAAAGISLSRYTAAPGDQVTVTGSGFHPGDASSVTAYLLVNGKPQQAPAFTGVNAGGNLQATITLPAGTNPGTYGVVARDSHGNTARQYLTVLPLVRVQVGTRVPAVAVIAGRQFYITGTGFGASEIVHVAATFTLYNGNSVTITTDKRASGAGGFYEAVLRVPRDARVGGASLQATGATSAKRANAPLYVVYRPAVSVSPGAVTPGGTITVRGYGFVPNTSVNVSITFPRTDASTLTLSKAPGTDGNGNFQTSLTLPGDVATGKHTVTAVDAVGNGSIRAATQVTVTPRPQPTPTAQPQSTATATPTATPPPPKKKGIGFRYVSLWYHIVRVGTWDELVIQAQPAKKVGVWVQVIFPNGKHYYYYENSNSHGLWLKRFGIPRNAISRYSHQADITMQLWSGSKTVRYFISFTLV